MRGTTKGPSSYATRCLLASALVASVAAPIAIRATNQRPDWDDHVRQDADRDRRPGGDDRDRSDAERTPIRHVVVIFQENVSFDHYFATYPHAANTDGSAFTARAGTPVANGLFPGGLLDHNPNSVQPFRLSSAQAATCDQDHNYKDEQKAFNAGGTESHSRANARCHDCARFTGTLRECVRQCDRDRWRWHRFSDRGSSPLARVRQLHASLPRPSRGATDLHHDGRSEHRRPSQRAPDHVGVVSGRVCALSRAEPTPVQHARRDRADRLRQRSFGRARDWHVV
jgi:hypothetical protein